MSAEAVALTRGLRARSEFSYVRRVLRRRRTGWVGLTLLGVLVLGALCAPLLARFPPEQADPSHILVHPSVRYWLGTDINGMDIYSRILYSLRIDLGIAVAATAMAGTIGTVLGAWIGFYSGRRWQGWIAEVLIRCVDALQSFPVFIFALGVVAILGKDDTNVLLVLTVLNIPVFLRLTRSATLSLREEPFIDAARCAGRSERQILVRHVLPNTMGPSITVASAISGGTILVTAGLGYLGAGVPAPAPELGSMVAIGASSLYSGQWWAAAFPGLAIGLTVLAFAWVGEIVSDYLDPRSR